MFGYRFEDRRSVPDNSNPFVDMRPSGHLRILKGTLECTLFLSVLSYGVTFNGFGIHTWYLQSVGKIKHLGPWMRTRTLLGLAVRYAVLSLPFYYTKEVVYGAIDSYTKERPKAKKLLNYAFINNVIAIVLCFPISYFLVSRNLMKGLRNSAVLGLFSMGNDLLIQFRRKHFIQSQMTQQDIRKRMLHKRIQELKMDLEETLKDKNTSEQMKMKLRMVNFQQIEREELRKKQPSTDEELQALRQKQIKDFENVFREQLKSFKFLF